MKANKKDTILRIRISTSDKHLVRDKAHKEHITISNYVRAKILSDGK